LNEESKEDTEEREERVQSSIHSFRSRSSPMDELQDNKHHSKLVISGNISMSKQII